MLSRLTNALSNVIDSVSLGTQSSPARLAYTFGVRPLTQLSRGLSFVRCAFEAVAPFAVTQILSKTQFQQNVEALGSSIKSTVKNFTGMVFSEETSESIVNSAGRICKSTLPKISDGLLTHMATKCFFGFSSMGFFSLAIPILISVADEVNYRSFCSNLNELENLALTYPERQELKTIRAKAESNFDGKQKSELCTRLVEICKIGKKEAENNTQKRKFGELEKQFKNLMGVADEANYRPFCSKLSELESLTLSEEQKQQLVEIRQDAESFFDGSESGFYIRIADICEKAKANVQESEKEKLEELSRFFKNYCTFCSYLSELKDLPLTEEQKEEIAEIRRKAESNFSEMMPELLNQIEALYVPVKVSETLSTDFLNNF